MKTDDLYRMIKENNKILLKPNYGFGGKGIFKVTYYSEKEAIINDNKLEYKKIYDIVSSYNDYIIMQFIDQHEYSYEMYPHTTNTIRIITIMNQDGHAEIPNVVHRIGVKNSIPVDNAAKGGLFSQV